METKSDILIAGGGLNGLTLALTAARSGLTSTVVDAQPEAAARAANFDGRAYALALASQRMLERLGLWQGLQAEAQPMLDIKVTDGRVGDGAVFLGLHFDHAEIEEGPMGFMVEDRHLRRILSTAAENEPRITIVPGTRITRQTTSSQGVSVHLDDGAQLSARVLIGADGRKSGTAERAGISRTGWDYGQTALVCAISHEKPHNGVAHQFFMPPGPLAVLPLTGTRSSIVWSEKTGFAQEINALSDDDYLHVLRPRFGDFLGTISLAGDRYTYPLGLTLADRWTSDRLALVGDAAHGVHPIAGQGLNAGLRDVAALSHVWHHAQRRGEDIAAPQVLNRYAEWRRFDTATLAASTDLFNRLYSNDNPLLRIGRDLGMAAVNRLPGLQRAFMREAAGLNGDLPDLMRA